MDNKFDSEKEEVCTSVMKISSKMFEKCTKEEFENYIKFKNDDYSIEDVVNDDKLGKLS